MTAVAIVCSLLGLPALFFTLWPGYWWHRIFFVMVLLSISYLCWVAWMLSPSGAKIAGG